MDHIGVDYFEVLGIVAVSLNEDSGDVKNKDYGLLFILPSARGQ